MHQKRLGDIASYINGYPFKPEQRGKVGIPIIRIQDLTGNAYDLGFYDGDYPKKVEINDGDVLISWSASLGVYEWNHGKALLNQHIFRVVFDKLTVDKEFFMYAVQYKLEEMESKAHGATMKHITKKDFDNTVIPFPTIVEQERISNTLNKLHTIIDSKKFQLEKLDDLIKARFVEMFGGIDRYISIKDSGLFIADGNYSSKYPRSSEFTSFGVPFIRANNIKDNTVVDDDMYFISPEKHDELKKGHLLHGDILVTTRGNIGQLGIVPQKHNNSNINAQIVLLRCRDTKYLPEYLLFALQTVDVKKQFIRQQTGTALKQLPVKHLEKISFIDAPVELQNQFATFVTQVDKSKFALSNELAMGNFYIRLIHDCIMHGCIDL